MAKDIERNLIRFSELEAERLAKFYAEAEREILDRLNRALLRGNKTEYLAQMRKNIETILADLRSGSRTWTEQAIPRIYVKGAATADMMIKAQGQSIIGGFGAIHQQAAQVLAENTFQSLDNAAQLIGRRTEDIYRTMALENIRGSVAGYDTWQQTARNFREKLAEKGVTGFQDKAGRQWNMRTYAETVARTGAMEAHLQGTANRLLEHGHDLVKVSTHAGACKLCVPWQGKILSLTGKTEGYPTLQETKEAGLFHPNCFPAGVLVSGPTPLATFTRWYEGEIVIITTTSGVELPVTPNHPILTSKGWVAAGLLNKGDDIIRYTVQKGMMGSIDPDYQDIPTLIEQVVDSFNKSRRVSTRCMPVSPEDFHGDGVGSNVYVVGTDCLLMDGGNAFLAKPSGKNTFCFADMRGCFLHTLRSVAQHLIRTFTAARSLIGGTNQGAPFIGGHPVQADFHGLGTILGGINAKFCETSLNCNLINSKTNCDVLFSFPGKIPTQNVIAVQRNAAVQSSFNKITNFNSVFIQDRLNGLLADVEGGCKLTERLSGSITTDKIVSIKVDQFSGHVYNLQTKDGWYVANSIITHNCRHAYGLHIDLDKEIAELEKELETPPLDYPKGVGARVNPEIIREKYSVEKVLETIRNSDWASRKAFKQ